MLANWSLVRLADRPIPKTLIIRVGLPQTVCLFVCDFIPLEIMESVLTFSKDNFCKFLPHALVPLLYAWTMHRWCKRFRDQTAICDWTREKSRNLNPGLIDWVIILKIFNCEHVPADGVVHIQAKQIWDMQKSYLLGRWQEKKSNEHCKITLKKAWLPLHFMLWNGSGNPIQHVISFQFWVKGILTVLFTWTRGRLSEMLKALLQSFCY